MKVIKFLIKIIKSCENIRIVYDYGTKNKKIKKSLNKKLWKNWKKLKHAKNKKKINEKKLWK